MQGEPYIPETITVHLGTPDSDAANVTVPFSDYVKNVASSEIFATWPENSLRANIYVIMTFALNRIYTEWYRSRGYPFDITSTTQFDQKYIHNREIFDTISDLVDELFGDYIRRQGSVEPLFSSFCNGTTVTCGGLSQWGTVDLANQGFTPYEILTYYYGDDIDIVRDAEIRSPEPSYPGQPLEEGDAGNAVLGIQRRLRRISQNYPAIPAIPALDGIFGAATRDAVAEFQRIFNLNPTGVVDKATWYKISYIYTSVKRLAELDSEGLSINEIRGRFPEELRLGSEGDPVRQIQYYLRVVGAYYVRVQQPAVTGVFDQQTVDSVISFQRVFGLPQTGVVDRRTWNDLYDAYDGIVLSVPPESTEVALFPGDTLKEGSRSEAVRLIQTYLTAIHGAYPEIPAVSTTGYFGPVTRAAVSAFQRRFGLTETGTVSANTWDEIARVYSDVRFGFDKRPYQFPGYVIQ